MVDPHKWSPMSYRSSMGQGKFAATTVPNFLPGMKHTSLPYCEHKSIVLLLLLPFNSCYSRWTCV